MGNDLLEEVTSQTDLPKELLQRELQLLLAEAKITMAEFDIEALRKLMANYLQDVFVEIKKEFAHEE